MLAPMSQMARGAVSSLALPTVAFFGRSFRVWGLVALLVCLLAGRAVSASPRFVLVTDPDSAAPNDGLRDISGAALQVLNERGQTVVAAPARLSGCTLPECAKGLAAATGASYELRIVANYDRESFKAAIELWDLGAARLVTSRTLECAICDLRDFAQAGRTLTTALLDEVDFEAQSPPAVRPLSEPGKHDSSGMAESRGIRALKHPLFLTTAAVGVALVTVGIVNRVRDGKQVCRDGEPKPCDFVRDSRGLGTALIAAGLGTAIAGGVGAWLRLSPTSSSDRIDGVALELSGHF